MYIPAAFREPDPATLSAFIEAHSFASLVTVIDHAPFATHLPFLLDSSRGEWGVLRSHMARANPQWQPWQTTEPLINALVIFTGPHAYISPAWYKSAPNVPTWNYSAVHAYGIPKLVSEEATARIVQETVERYESERAEPWGMNAPGDYFQRLLKGVVGFEIEIARLEGKFKWNQNKSNADRVGVIEGLRAEGKSVIADWMERLK